MLQHAAMAPVAISMRPSIHPHKVKTYGNERTPDPIAEAHSENILPLSLPLLILPNALLKNVLLCYPPGDIISLASLTLISSVAALNVLGEAGDPSKSI